MRSAGCSRSASEERAVLILRDTDPGRAGDGFFSLSRRERILLLILLCGSVLVDFLLLSTAPTGSSSDVVAVLAPVIAAGIFTLSPPAGALSLLTVSLAQTFDGDSGSETLMLALAAGLVTYTSPRWFSAAYVLAGALLISLAAARSGSLTAAAVPALLAIGLASALIGRALRRAQQRSAAQAAHIARITEEREKSLRTREGEIAAERSRIADELHDIIAHDLTIISMQARVLEGSASPSDRAIAVDAIRERSAQALADIRRALLIVRKDSPEPSSMGTAEHRDTIAATLDALRSSLAQGSLQIDSSLSPGTELSEAIEQTAVHVLREGCTNAIKHGSDPPSVSIDIRSSADSLSITVSNMLPAQDAPARTESGGYGLVRLRERTSLHGGELSTREEAGRFRLSARLPLR